MLIRTIRPVILLLVLLNSCQSRPFSQPNKEKEKGFPIIISQYSNVRMSKYNAQTTKDSPLPQIIPNEDGQSDKASLALTHDTDKQSKVADMKEAAKETEVKATESDTSTLQKVDEEIVEDVTTPEPVSSSSEATSTTTSEAPLVSKVEDSKDTADLPLKESEPEMTKELATEPVPPTESTNVDENPAPSDDAAVAAAPFESEGIQKEKEQESEMKVTEEDSKTDFTGSNDPAQNEPLIKQTDEKTGEEQVDTDAVPKDELETPRSQSLPAFKATQLQIHELFEEDRSFKDSFEELNLAAVARSTSNDDEDPANNEEFDGKNQESALTSSESDEVVEGLRLEREDKKADKKGKEKEKMKGFIKEAKPIKHMKPALNDDNPVDEYEPKRDRRSDSPSSQSEPELVSVKDAALVETDDETIVISLVPDNHPIVLPNGESTLSDKLTPDEVKSISETVDEPEPIVFSVVPDNYPVVLPNGESTLSDKVIFSDEVQPSDKKKEGPEPITTFGVVPDNYPVVLPNGESTLSDKVPSDKKKGESEPIIIGVVPDNYPVVLPSGESTLSDEIKSKDKV